MLFAPTFYFKLTSVLFYLLKFLGVFVDKVKKKKKKKNVNSLFKVGVNEMPVRPTHDDMATWHAISGVGLLTPLGVDTIVTKYPSNQL